MEYFKASWLHSLDDEPILFYSEIDENRNEIRKVEIYRDNSFGLADLNFEFGGARLGLESVPPIDEINSQAEFLAQSITREEFEEVWHEYTRFLK
jgi:hypothetical protein